MVKINVSYPNVYSIIIIINHGLYVAAKNRVSNGYYTFLSTISDVNDAELRLSFSEKKTSPSRTKTLAKRARAELRLLQNIAELK